MEDINVGQWCCFIN